MTPIEAQRQLLYNELVFCQSIGCHEYTVKYGVQQFSSAISNDASLSSTSSTTLSPKPVVKLVSGNPVAYHGPSEYLGTSSGQQDATLVYEISRIPRSFTVDATTYGYEIDDLLPAVTDATQRAVILITGPDAPSELVCMVKSFRQTAVHITLTVETTTEY
ncbi:MAG: hypothetical protein E6Q97_36650 [Desulfurellales bacterium]|nr:MAG: hypothetical protein E6Q97_36650 [Desulfurellales bacterium]